MFLTDDDSDKDEAEDESESESEHGKNGKNVSSAAVTACELRVLSLMFCHTVQMCC